MKTRFYGIPTILPIVLLAFAAFIVATAGVVAEKATTNQTVAQTVRNHQTQCGDLGGTFTTGGWTTPGDKSGTMVSTTFTKCDLGGGDVTTCYHVPGSVDCRVNISAPPNARDEATSQDDALADNPFGVAPDITTADRVDEADESHSGPADSTPIPATLQPTVVPVAEPRG